MKRSVLKDPRAWESPLSDRLLVGEWFLLLWQPPHALRPESTSKIGEIDRLVNSDKARS